MSSHSEPLVEALMAEVRVLQVGSKPVTLSAARQLDHVDQNDIKPFGRGQDRPQPRPHDRGHRLSGRSARQVLRDR